MSITLDHAYLLYPYAILRYAPLLYYTLSLFYSISILIYLYSTLLYSAAVLPGITFKLELPRTKPSSLAIPIPARQPARVLLKLPATITTTITTPSKPYYTISPLPRTGDPNYYQKGKTSGVTFKDRSQQSKLAASCWITRDR